jgi:CheY-like chemotaxis protein
MAHAAECGSQRDITTRSRESRNSTLNKGLYLFVLQCCCLWGWASGGRPPPCAGFLIWVLIMETVLIVEDDTETRDTLTTLLEKDGREIVTAGDGQEAFERLSEVPRPCLILLDLMMPRMNGLEFLRRRSTDPAIANIPTIVLSGSTLPAGAKHQLAKPVDAERLLALVDQYC